MTYNQKANMQHLVLLLNEARKVYYTGTDEEPTMTDAKYDKLLQELEELERETGVIFQNSPTINVGYEPPDKLPHTKPVLSLKSTKSVDELLYFLGEHEGILSWKLDGVSIVLYYKDGILEKALTRGDGHVGKNIMNNAFAMDNIPKEITSSDERKSKGEFIVRGEGCISLQEFDAIKKTKTGEKFSNPRNLAAGIMNTTKSTNILLRHVKFIAHSLTTDKDEELLEKWPELKPYDKKSHQLDYLRVLGFDVVPYIKVLNFELMHAVEDFTNKVSGFKYPVDGLVLSLDDIDYGDSLGATAKYPKHSIAYKWPDELAYSNVTGIKWSVSQTGLITPIVQFEPIELEGTIVKQANLHTLKNFEGLGIGIGDTLRIYKANKIIPEVDENMTRSKTLEYPKYCPVCEHETTVVENERTRKLYCNGCGGKKDD